MDETKEIGFAFKDMENDCDENVNIKKVDHNHSEHLHQHKSSCAGCSCGDKSKEHDKSGIKDFIGPMISLVLMVAGLIIDHLHEPFFNSNTWVKPLWYFIAFLPVGVPVIIEAVKGVFAKDYFNELTLMSIACVGAFLIGEYSEAVGVMLFYFIGETLQDRAVDKATRDISKLLDIKAQTARILEGKEYIYEKPEKVTTGTIIEVRPGERVPLDGKLISDTGLFDTAALTGESIPREIDKDGEVLAGMIAADSTVLIKVDKPYHDSALSRILELVKNAQERKAKSEVFIKKFARIYTPIVTLLALLVVVIPAFISFIDPSFNYVFSEWLYRALVFLVISCPCALVISVPLSYFAGIGASSKSGILFKGGNYLEAITHINNVAFDKTGTLTTGEFEVEEVESFEMNKPELLSLMAAVESHSNHPLAKAIVNYVNNEGIPFTHISETHEISGKGAEAIIDDKEVLVGNLRLLREKNIVYPEKLNSTPSTIVACAINNIFAGYVVLSDTLKEDAKTTVSELRKLGIEKIIMLSGDRREIVKKYADKLGIKHAHGELLPQDKASIVENIAKTKGKNIAFVGDGMNDAPVLSLSNVGIAMGGLGSDAAIESADVVIQTDKPSRVATAIKIGRYTHKIVVQNIAGALVIKVVVLTLGLWGIATLWAAVFADVGVTMLAVLNSMRIMWKKF